jgi:hypothetical protein
MPDIAMCLHATCPSRTRCYRHMARPSQPYQWYAEHTPGPNGVCPSFLAVEDCSTDANIG